MLKRHWIVLPLFPLSCSAVVLVFSFHYNVSRFTLSSVWNICHTLSYGCLMTGKKDDKMCTNATKRYTLERKLWSHHMTHSPINVWRQHPGQYLKLTLNNLTLAAWTLSSLGRLYSRAKFHGKALQPTAPRLQPCCEDTKQPCHLCRGLPTSPLHALEPIIQVLPQWPKSLKIAVIRLCCNVTTET